MKILSFLLLSTATILYSCSNSENKTEDSKDSTQAQNIVTSVLPKYFYKRLEGTIAGQPVIMELNKANNLAAGSYYYTSSGKSIMLDIDTAISQDSLILREYILGDESEGVDAKLYLKWNGKGFTGQFQNKKGKFSPIILNENYPAGSYKFNVDSLTANLKAFPEKDKSPKASLAIQYLTYTGKNAAWVNNNIKTIFEIKNNEDWKAAFKKQADEYFKDYRKEAKELADNRGSDDELYFLNYESYTNTRVRYNANDFVVIEAMNYVYSGGAHGNYGSGFYNYDVANQKVLKLNDILTADSTTLNKIALKFFRSQYNIKNNEPLSKVTFEDTLSLNDNFYINSKGISFLFNPYEIASYAQGQLEVFIPFEAVKNYLKPEFKQRIGVNR
jgi:hypothetical protein